MYRCIKKLLNVILNLNVKNKIYICHVYKIEINLFLVFSTNYILIEIKS